MMMRLIEREIRAKWMELPHARMSDEDWNHAFNQELASMGGLDDASVIDRMLHGTTAMQSMNLIIPVINHAVRTGFLPGHSLADSIPVHGDVWECDMPHRNLAASRLLGTILGARRLERWSREAFRDEHGIEERENRALLPFDDSRWVNRHEDAVYANLIEDDDDTGLVDWSYGKGNMTGMRLGWGLPSLESLCRFGVEWMADMLDALVSEAVRIGLRPIVSEYPGAGEDSNFAMATIAFLHMGDRDEWRVDPEGNPARFGCAFADAWSDIVESGFTRDDIGAFPTFDLFKRWRRVIASGADVPACAATEAGLRRLFQIGHRGWLRLLGGERFRDEIVSPCVANCEHVIRALEVDPEPDYRTIRRIAEELGGLPNPEICGSRYGLGWLSPDDGDSSDRLPVAPTRLGFVSHESDGDIFNAAIRRNQSPSSVIAVLNVIDVLYAAMDDVRSEDGWDFIVVNGRMMRRGGPNRHVGENRVVAFLNGDGVLAAIDALERGMPADMVSEIPELRRRSVFLDTSHDSWERMNHVGLKREWMIMDDEETVA